MPDCLGCHRCGALADGISFERLTVAMAPNNLQLSPFFYIHWEASTKYGQSFIGISNAMDGTEDYDIFEQSSSETTADSSKHSCSETSEDVDGELSVSNAYNLE